MAIYCNVNGEVKTAKDVYLGTAQGVPRRVLKMLTSVNGEKKTLYEYNYTPPVLNGYYLIGNTRQIIHTTDFRSYDTVLNTDATASAISDIVYANNKLYCFCGFSKTYISDDGKNFTEYSGNEIVDSYATDIYVYMKTPMSPIKYYKGNFYRYMRASKSSTSGAKYLFLAQSSNGYDWHIHESGVTLYWDTSGTNIFALLGFIDDGIYSYPICRSGWQYKSNSQNVICRDQVSDGRGGRATIIINLQTSLVAGWDVGANISDTEVVIRSGKHVYLNNGTITGGNYSVNTIPEVYDGTHFYGKWKETSQSIIYYDATSTIITSLQLTKSMPAEDGALFIGSISGQAKLYGVSSSGLVTDKGNIDSKFNYTSSNAWGLVAFIPNDVES